MYIRSNSTMANLIYYTCTSLVFLTIFALSLFCYPVEAQQTPKKAISASSPNPVGSGARAVGMGGAFIAIADDATAASWNPAGLTQLMKPEISFAYSYFRRRDDFSSSEHPETSGVQKSSSTELNFLSVAYPFELFERNMIVSLNYQLLYEFERDIRTKITSPFLNQKIKFRQSGKLRALSPAYAIEVTPGFSLGFTFNIWTDKLFWSNGWKSDTNIEATAFTINKTIIKDKDRYSGFSGFNMNIGFLWDINRFLTIGGVVKTPFTGEMKHEHVVETRSIVPAFPFRINEDIDLEMPLSYGLGIALRFSDRFTISFDVYRTEWDQFKLKDGNGNRINPITGKPSHESSTKETHQVRLGAEYFFVFTNTAIPVRWGIFYDPEPSEKNPEDFWGFSLGSGISIGDLIFDCAYQFRYGDDVKGDTFDLPSTSADVTQHLFLVSFIYHF